MAPRSPTSFLHRLRRGLWGMLLPCVAVALLGVASTLNSNDAIDKLATEVVDEYGAVSTVRDQLGELFTIGQAGLRGAVEPGAPTFEEQLLVVLAAFDDASAKLDPDEVASLGKARQHLMNVVAQGAALTTGDLDLAEFRASVETEALEAFRDLDAIYQVGAAEFVDDTAAVSKRTNQILALVGIVVVAAVAAEIILVRRLRNALYRPLRELEVGLEQFAVDGLGHRIEVDGDREFRSVAAVVNTMAAQLDESLAELAHRAFHDPLTDLANRAQLERRLTRQLDAPRRSSGGSGGPAGAVVVLDLDGFKAVN
ncbi:MAG: HAMP domain-containing protein, partial [Ilumatobacteraceae bacterium]